MKKLVALLMLVLCAGCSYEGKTFEDYMHDPGAIIKDPHYSSYKEKRDALESQYLNKKITYPEYIEKVKALDNKYNQEVDKRNRIIESDY